MSPANAPARRRRRAARVHFRERLVERTPAGRARRERLNGVLARTQERLAHLGGTRGRRCEIVLRRWDGSRLVGRRLHRRSACLALLGLHRWRPSPRARSRKDSRWIRGTDAHRHYDAAP